MDDRTAYLSDTQQISILYTQSITTFFFPVLAAFFLAAILRNIATRQLLTAWLLVIVLHAALRYYMLWQYFHAEKSAQNDMAWMYKFTLWVFFSGVIWGLAGIILIPYQTTETTAFILYNGLILLTTCGLVAGAVIFYAISLRVLCCYSLPALIPPAFYLISLGDQYNTAFGGLILLYHMFILVAGIRMHRQFVYFLNMEYQQLKLQQKYDNLKRIYDDYRYHARKQATR